MTTLGVWAAANLAVGLAGDLAGGDEPARYAYQMSWMWGAVNGVLAGVGLAGALGASPGARPYREALMEARSTETLFLVNGVLDLAYVGAGAWLWERGLRTADPRTQGYGQAVVVQGAFLLLFDGVLLLLRRDLRLGLEALPVDLVPVPRGAGLSWRF